MVGPGTAQVAIATCGAKAYVVPVRSIVFAPNLTSNHSSDPIAIIFYIQ
jgi:hypothetical protein